MVFMVVATLLGIDSSSPIVSILPIMIVLWLISMNIFVSPAVSLVEMFAPKKSLPIVMAVLVFFNEIVYALEPLVVGLVQFFGDVLTFVVGGVLIISTGLFFYRQTKDEVKEKQEISASTVQSESKFMPIVYAGALIGLGKGFLVEYLPNLDHLEIISGEYLAFFMLGLSAFVAFLSRNYVVRLGAEKVLFKSLIIILISSFSLFLSNNEIFILIFSLILSASFGLASITGIPFAISKLSPKAVTFGIGVFIGVSEITPGLIEIFNSGGF